MNILVTGASRGLGEDIVSALQKVGHRAIGCARNGEIPVDLSQHGEPQRLAQEVVKRFGKIDMLVNNARADRSDDTEEHWDNVLGVNLRSVHFLTKALVPHITTGVVNIGSISGSRVSRDSVAYQVSKAGLEQLTRIQAVEYAPLRVNCIAAGYFIKSANRQKFDGEDNKAYRERIIGIHPTGTAGVGSDIAQAVIYLAHAKFMTGATITMDGGATLKDPFY